MKNILEYWHEFDSLCLPEVPQHVLLPDSLPYMVNRECIEKHADFGRPSFRLSVYFQCHKPSYMLTEVTLTDPNYRCPSCYMLKVDFVPRITSGDIAFQLDDSDDSCIVNTALLMALYRQQNVGVNDSEPMMRWVQARTEEIKARLSQGLDGDTTLTGTQNLSNCIKGINRYLMDVCWPTPESKKGIVSRMVNIDGYLKDAYFDGEKNILTFPFRYQLGLQNDSAIRPFFADDLLMAVQKHDQGELSTPLAAYLNAEQNLQATMPEPTYGKPYCPQLLADRPLGRWPSDPRYSLNLLQSTAFSVINQQGNPIVPVNGPPGTGKTTLLKEVIADRFVKRTKDIAERYRRNAVTDTESWLSDLVGYAMVVSSANNAAVENISAEIPEISGVHEGFRDTLGYFASCASEGRWGLFSAVLGNTHNHQRFCQDLGKLKAFLYGERDYLGLYGLVRGLKSGGDRVALMSCWTKEHSHERDDALRVAAKAAKLKWLEVLFERWQQSTARSLDEEWAQLEDSQWQALQGAIERMAKYSYANQFAEKRIDARLEKAYDCFSSALGKLRGGYYTNPYRGKCMEISMQMHEPWAGMAENQLKSEVFVAAVRFNEALVIKLAKDLLPHFGSLEKITRGQSVKASSVSTAHLWGINFLLFPVVSTTLASVSRVFAQMSEAAIGLVMLDESGQSLPYMPVGLLQRAKQAVVVGDPIQIEPVTTLRAEMDESMMQRHNVVGPLYKVSESSAQLVADRAGRYRSHIGDRAVGLKLLVHRRCSNPMFGIANNIAYNKEMVLADTEKSGSGIWLNVMGNSKNKYCNDAEILALENELSRMAIDSPQCLKDGFFIITPFASTARYIRKHWDGIMGRQSILSEILTQSMTERGVKHFAKTHIGTVHTFQGKESKTVFFMLSATVSEMSGVNWVNQGPNLINVAVTRAKQNLIVVGERDLWADGKYSSGLASALEVKGISGSIQGVDHIRPKSDMGHIDAVNT